MYSRTKQKVYILLDPMQGNTFWDKLINSFIVTLIILNTIAVATETISSIYITHEKWFKLFDHISIVVFTAEYILRVWSCTSNRRYKHPVKGRLRYIFSTGGMIDLLAILPFYLPLFLDYDLRFIRILRLIRFFKLSRYLNASRVISQVFRSRKEELVLSFVIIFFLIILSSAIMYHVEHGIHPNKFTSIPETMLWSIGTLTTVGYGDQSPTTDVGRFLTAFISILGIGVFALPAGILASGFSDEFKKLKRKNCCPHCGKYIEH